MVRIGSIRSNWLRRAIVPPLAPLVYLAVTLLYVAIAILAAVNAACIEVGKAVAELYDALTRELPGDIAAAWRGNAQ